MFKYAKVIIQSVMILSIASSAVLGRKLDSQELSAITPGTEALYLGNPHSTKACLLVHGYAGSRKDFGDLGQKIADNGFLVRMVRLPGHGTTAEEHSTVTADELIEGARQELLALKSSYESVYLIGFSMGGAISTIIASQENPHALVLAAPYFKVTKKWFYGFSPEQWNKALMPVIKYVPKAKWTTRVNKRENKKHLFSYSRLSTKSVSVLNELGERARNPDLLNTVTMPTLAIHSLGDDAADPATSQNCFDQLGSKEKQFIWLDKKNNHHIFWDYDSEYAINTIVEFLNNF